VKSGGTPDGKLADVSVTLSASCVFAGNVAGAGIETAPEKPFEAGNVTGI
jgi:hypothetical protein